MTLVNSGVIAMPRCASVTRLFSIDDHTVSFAAGHKNGLPVVVFGIKTNLNSVPFLTIEKDWHSLADAERYVSSVSEIAAHKLLDHYTAEYQDVAERIDAVFSREKTGFIAPDRPVYRYGRYQP